MGFPRQVGIENVPDIIAMILLPVAVLMCGYALMVFLWRGSQIARKQVRCFAQHYPCPALHCLGMFSAKVRQSRENAQWLTSFLS